MAEIAMEIPSEERRVIEGVCTKLLRTEAMKKNIPLEKVFRRPHPHDVVDMGRRFMKELELVIPLILDSVELEIAKKEASTLLVDLRLSSPWGNV